MPPSSTSARVVWVWSLPAFVIILSYLWYRKKRGSLKTDSGGTGGEHRVLVPVDTADDVTEDELVPVDEEAVHSAVGEPLEESAPTAVEAEEQEVVKEQEAEPDPEPEPQPQPEPSKCSKKRKSQDMAKKANEEDAEQRQGGEETAATILEQKLAKLELAKQCGGGVVSEDKVEGEGEGGARDSANNSPSEVMLASPSMSGYSDTHSEGSSDSGKGCSEVLTPSRTPVSGNSVSGDLSASAIYEFVIPQHLVGRLIGRYGSYINEIKEATNASIYVKLHPDTSKLKICAIEGSQMDIDSALDMIRRKFPKKRYPNLSLEQVVLAPETSAVPMLPENMQLYLVEGINNDVILSSLVSAGHFFLQQPTHPTYLSLGRLDSCMALCYAEPNQPTMPEGFSAGALCAAPVHNGWYRAEVTRVEPGQDACDVKFVDYGGYMTLPVAELRQIRVDFINLPFQAAECYLANVQPAAEDGSWCSGAKELVEKLTFGKVLQAQVYGYADDGVPLIYLYTVLNNEVILINQELVTRGFAEWLYPDPVMDGVVSSSGLPALPVEEPVGV